MDQENLPVWIQNRLVQFSAEDNLPLHIYANRDAPFNLENKDAFKQVVAYVKANHIGLLILDTLRLSHARDENSSTDMKPVFDRLKQLTKHTTVIFIQHHRKVDRNGRGKVHGEDMMGSILIRGSVDYQLSIVKLSDVSETVTQIKVTQTKARYTKNLKPFTLTLEEHNQQLTFSYGGPNIETPQLTKRQQAQEAILKLLKSQPQTRLEITDYLTSQNICSTRTTDSALKDLKDRNLIYHDLHSGSQYRLPEQTTSTEPALQSLQSTQLQCADNENGGRENALCAKNQSATTTNAQVQNGTLQTAIPLRRVQIAKQKDNQREKAADIIGALHSGDLQRRIIATKKWLLEHAKCNHPNPPFRAKEWFRQLLAFQLLVDEAQMRGIDRDEDWLEMARMSFHTDDGDTGKWLDAQ